MQKLLILFSTLSCFNAFACSEALRPYEEECKAQDRYQKLLSEFKTYSIDMNNLKGYKIPKAIGKNPYFSSKNELLNYSEAVLPKNKDWQVWSNGQKFINDLSPILLEYSDIPKLHKSLFAGKSFFSSPGDLGKLRSNSAQTNPKITLTCFSKVLNDKNIELLSDYDLKSAEGYPLLSLENINGCEDQSISSAELYYYKGASVKTELVRWINDLNDMIYRYESASAPADFGPYHYLSDMRRWFLAIKPFQSGNEEVVAAILDYTAKRLQLTPLSLGDLAAPVFLSVDENRKGTLNKIHETLTFFEGCLFETKTKLVSSECSSL